MKYISIREAIGKRLGYDVPYSSPNGGRGVLERGHIITEDDVKKLMDSGIYFVWIDDGEKEEGIMYEWEITPYVASKIAGENVEVVPEKQGLVTLRSKIPGLVKVDFDGLVNFNLNRNVFLITKKNYDAVGKGDVIGYVDTIPLSMNKSEVEKIIPTSKLISVIPFKYTKIGVVVTGTEIYEGRKKDMFIPVMEDKAKKYGWSIVKSEIVPDDEDMIAKAILSTIDSGAEAVIVSGGISVDPTDRTIYAFKKLNAQIISHGIPVKPFTMTIVAVLGNTPLMGVTPGVIHFKDYNIIDIIFTRMMAGIIPTLRDLAELSYGGILVQR